MPADLMALSVAIMPWMMFFALPCRSRLSSSDARPSQLATWVLSGAQFLIMSVAAFSFVPEASVSHSASASFRRMSQ
eukprot:9475012-Pyramimonas_sp.AAC.1